MQREAGLVEAGLPLPCGGLAARGAGNNGHLPMGSAGQVPRTVVTTSSLKHSCIILTSDLAVVCLFFFFLIGFLRQ